MKKTVKLLALAGLLLLFSAGLIFAGGNKEVPEIPPVTSGVQYISPNGDGVQDEATLQFSVRLFVKSKKGYVPEYGLSIHAENGDMMITESHSEKRDVNWFASIFRGYDEFTLEREITWDGKDDKGNVVPDGTYNVKLWVKDANKHEQAIDVDNFVVDTKAPSAQVSFPNGLMFAPNGDGMLDTLRVDQTGGSVEDLWEAAFRNESGDVVKSYTWTSGSPAGFDWDAMTNDNTKAPDGIYEYSLQSKDRAGNSFSFVQPGIVLDSSAPLIRLSIDNPYFSPNGDGIKDSCTLAFLYDETEDAASWSWSLASDGTVFRQEKGGLPLPESLVLDGTDEQGAPLPQGRYSFSYSVEYANGWRPVIEDFVTVDMTPPQVALLVPQIIFSPNGDGLNDIITISFRANEPVTWIGAIADKNGNVIQETDVPQTHSLLTWDGTNTQGEIIPDGEYVILGKFSDYAGNVSYNDPFTIYVDTRPVGITVENPVGFSPNGDGRDDVIDFTIDAQLPTDILRWVLSIRNSRGEETRSFTGTDTLPGKITWDGNLPRQDDTDRQVLAPEGQYTARLSVDYLKGDKVVVNAVPFSLALSVPEIYLEVAADPFIKTEDGIEGDVFVSVVVESKSEITDWNLEIRDDRGHLLRTYSGTGDPTGDIAWSAQSDPELGTGEYDEFVISLAVTDAGGNVTRIQEKLALDIILVRRDGKLFLMVPNIIFGAYKDTLDSAGPRQEQINRDSLRKVVDIHRRYPAYLLGLEAHALNIYLNGPRQNDEEKILFPLTERRAANVQSALIDLGINAAAIRTQAYGGLHPIASTTNSADWWKNRRVEFIMIENE